MVGRRSAAFDFGVVVDDHVRLAVNAFEPVVDHVGAPLELQVSHCYLRCIVGGELPVVLRHSIQQVRACILQGRLTDVLKVPVAPTASFAGVTLVEALDQLHSGGHGKILKLDRRRSEVTTVIRLDGLAGAETEREQDGEQAADGKIQVHALEKQVGAGGTARF